MTKKTVRRKAADRQLPSSATEIILRASAASRLVDEGPQALSDIDLLALLLRTDANTTPYEESTRLLTKHGSLRDILCINPRSPSNAELSPRNYVTLQAALELARRHYQQTMMRSPALISGQAVHQFVRAQLRDRDYEVFCCIFLDSQMRVKDFKELFRGSLSAAHVHVGEVAKIALASNAFGVIAIHNHPSGSPEPTVADRATTLNLQAALRLIEIPLIDHLIVAEQGVLSFADRGFL